MELRLRGSFERDVTSYTNTLLLNQIFEAIENVKNAKSPAHIDNIKQLRKYRNLYRIKIAYNYRIGVIIKKNKIWFVRFGHRNNFYNKFP